MRSIIRQASEANDDLGVRIARAQLALLERCSQGDVTEGWNEFVRGTPYAEYVNPRLQGLWTRFTDARDRDLEGAAAIGEELVATSARFHALQSAAAGAFDTARAYWDRTDGDRDANVERSCQLLERALDLCEREPDVVDSDANQTRVCART